MPYIGNVTTSSNVNGSQINNGTITGDKLSLPFDYDSATLYLDNTNNRVGILTASPSSTLTVGTGGVVSIPLASAATPSLVFGTDTNTGIYSPGADQLAISTNGTGRLSIDSSGNVGIAAAGGEAGYTNYNKALVFGSSAETTLGIVLRTGSTGTSSIAFADNSGSGAGAQDGLIEYSQTTRALNFHTAGNSSPRLVIDSSGRLGVGTSIPGTKLEVNGDILSSGRGTSFGYKLPDCRVFNPSSGGIFAIDDYTNTRFFIDTSGRLGIGTSAPLERLHIGGTGNKALITPVTFGVNQDSAYLIAGSPSYTGATTSWGTFGFQHRIKSNAGGAGRVTIDTKTGEAFCVTDNNLVGIGTTSPGHNLEIKGSFPDFAISDSDIANDKFRILYNSGSTQLQVDPNNVSSGSHLLVAVDNTERARIDSSGRLLVGTSTAAATYVSLGLQGNGSVATNQATLAMARGSNPSGNSQELGRIEFFNNNSNSGGTIVALSEGAWTTGSSHPTRLAFSTTADGAASPTERMRLSNIGSLSIFGGTNSNPVASRHIAAAGITDNLYLGYHSATDTTNGTLSFIVRTNGNVLNTNNSYGAISDAKLKENIIDAGSQWSDLKALQVRKYNFKESQTHTQIGLVAQEVELVSPGLVSESPDRDKDGNDLGTVTKSVNYSVLYMKAVKALQEAMERIETLEASNTGLLARVTALESA
jgi:hypothetical protein